MSPDELAAWRAEQEQRAVDRGCMLRTGCDPTRYAHGTDCPQYPWPLVLERGFPA